MLDAVLKLKSDFVCEALDLAAVHSAWTFNYLEDGQHDRAVAAFRRFLNAVREAATEVKEIEAEMSARKLTGEAAVEWRRDRDRTRLKGKGAETSRTCVADERAPLGPVLGDAA